MHDSDTTLRLLTLQVLQDLLTLRSCLVNATNLMSTLALLPASTNHVKTHHVESTFGQIITLAVHDSLE